MTGSLKYWNSLPEDKEFTADFRLEAFAARVVRSAGILDVGCGYGRLLALLDGAGYTNIRGVDVSESLIRRGRALHPGLKMELQRPGELDFPDGGFDAAVLCAVLTCIPGDGDQQRLADEIFRVLRPGGVLYCNDFLLNDDERNLERYRCFEPRFGCYGVFELPGGATVRHHSEAHIRELFSGFLPDSFEQTVFRTMNHHTSRGFHSFWVKPF
ncbi:MAG: class I SAM-dependent methyltransferase [Victivallaceae bacterium]